MNYSKLSKIVSHALRHEPWLYELELDEEGWVFIDQLMDVLRTEEEWKNLTEGDLKNMILLSDKKRHEIKDNRIRAIYGHSTPEKIIHEQSVPPEILFHGTSSENKDRILQTGLRPMQRHYVHMSVLKEDAEAVGKRKTKSPVVLKIRALEASESGIKFFRGNDKIWLANAVPAEFCE